jgi:hypothetical protein
METLNSIPKQKLAKALLCICTSPKFYSSADFLSDAMPNLNGWVLHELESFKKVKIKCLLVLDGVKGVLKSLNLIKNKYEITNRLLMLDSDNSTFSCHHS